jgi:glutamate 5-kinase
VVNENDTVVTEEIRYGDNDRLAARVAQMVGADLLVLLSDIDGLYTADPRRDPSATHIEWVSEITPQIAAMAEGANAAAYKAWIAGSLAPQGWVTIDAGAAKALVSGKSLLAAGVRAIEGPFGKGDAVRVRDETGREVARGLVRYDSADAHRIAGLRSDAIEAELGFTEGPMIHADDLAVSA